MNNRHKEYICIVNYTPPEYEAKLFDDFKGGEIMALDFLAFPVIPPMHCHAGHSGCW
ncbi:MAG: hypothetical protein LBD03_03515 [Methanobrevibacter sp.]|nr:hypothetical protein [Candidatus Methanovirga procula]